MVRAFGRRECTPADHEACRSTCRKWFVRRGVLVDDQVGDDDAPAERGHQQKQDDHQLSAILALAHLAEPFDHLVKRTAVRFDGVVGVVGAREGVVRCDTCARQSPLPVGVRPRVHRDGVPREEDRWEQEDVRGVEVQLEVFGLQPLERSSNESQNDRDAPCKASSSHDCTRPGHHPATAACVLGFHPGLAYLDCVEDRDDQVEHPHSKKE